MLPVLRALADGKDTPVRDVRERVASAEGLTDKDLRSVWHREVRRETSGPRGRRPPRSESDNLTPGSTKPVPLPGRPRSGAGDEKGGGNMAEFRLLMKFLSQKKYVDQMRAGRLHMKRLKYFRECEDARADKYEGTILAGGRRALHPERRRRGAAPRRLHRAAEVQRCSPR